MIGILSGFIATAPVKQWRTSIQDGLRHGAMGMSALYALLWMLSRRMEDGVAGILCLALGIGAVVGGVWMRRAHWVRKGSTGGTGHAHISTLFIMYGVAAMTTSPLVLSSVGRACMATWLSARGRNDHNAEEPSSWFIMRESALIARLGPCHFILVAARGVLPF